MVDRVEDLLTSRGQTLTDLAGQLGCSGSALRRRILRTGLRVSELEPTAEFLGVTLQWLITGRAEVPTPRRLSKALGLLQRRLPALERQAQQAREAAEQAQALL